MAEPRDTNSPLESDRTHKLIGQFIHQFSLVEAALNSIIGHLFELNVPASDILLANIDFSRKVNIVHSMLVEQAKADRKPKTVHDELDRLFNNVRGLNDPDRQIVAHSVIAVEPPETVRFKRRTARKSLQNGDIVWDSKKFDQRLTAMKDAIARLEKLTIKPITNDYFSSSYFGRSYFGKGYFP